MERDQALDALLALATETRLDAFRAIAEAGSQGLASRKLAGRLRTVRRTVAEQVGELVETGLVFESREGGDTRYVAEPHMLRALFAYLGGQAPGVGPDGEDEDRRPSARPFDKILAAGRRFNVLFLCTHNSARSIMAEAILNHDHGARFQAFSAGSAPSGEISADALALLERLGYPTEGLRSKSWDEFAAPSAPEMDFVFTVCDGAAAETCPVFPGTPMQAHWGVPDPRAVTGDPTRRRLAHLDAFRMLERRIGVFASLPFAALEQTALKRSLERIGADDAGALAGPE